MRSRDATILVVTIVVVLVALLVAGVGLGAFGTTTSVIVDEGPSVVLDPPVDGSSGVVWDLRRTDARRILGIRYRRAEHHAAVAVVVPPECVRVTSSGHEELRDDGPCADLPIRGELSGGGVLGSGHTFVFVRLPVSEECFEALEPGDRWPVESGPCTEE